MNLSTCYFKLDGSTEGINRHMDFAAIASH